MRRVFVLKLRNYTLIILTRFESDFRQWEWGIEARRLCGVKYFFLRWRIFGTILRQQRGKIVSLFNIERDIGSLTLILGAFLEAVIVHIVCASRINGCEAATS